MNIQPNKSKNMAKLGVSYNCFTGSELLEHSIKSIRDNVDFVCVVYSLTSFRATTISYDFMPMLNRLVNIGLIDKLVEFHPNYGKAPKPNEIDQRNTGLQLCKEADCTHFMTMDVDELYNYAEFKECKDKVIIGNYDSSACQMLSYYKYGNVIIDPPEEYYVPFIYKINEVDKFGMKAFPVIVDNTRIYTLGKNILFKRDELQMHHYTYVRDHILEKLLHSATPCPEHKMSNIENYYKLWTPKMPNKKILTYNGYFNFKIIEPLFNINLYKI